MSWPQPSQPHRYFNMDNQPSIHPTTTLHDQGRTRIAHFLDMLDLFLRTLPPASTAVLFLVGVRAR